MSGRAGWRVLMSSSLLIGVGCGWSQRETYRRDPLLRDPRSQVAAPTAPVSSTAVEPAPTPRPILPSDLPSIAYDSREPPLIPDGPALPVPPPKPERNFAELHTSAGQPTDNLELVRAPEVTPPIESTLEKAAHMAPPRRHLASLPGSFAADADYRRLKGILDRNSRGVYLRYCDGAEEDRWGGKVRLEEPTRFEAFADQSVIEVEGELIPPPEGSGECYPKYRTSAAHASECEDLRSVHR